MRLFLLVERGIKNKKSFQKSESFCDPDGTRTRDLRRDRAAF